MPGGSGWKTTPTVGASPAWAAKSPTSSAGWKRLEEHFDIWSVVCLGQVVVLVSDTSWRAGWVKDVADTHRSFRNEKIIRKWSLLLLMWTYFGCGCLVAENYNESNTFQHASTALTGTPPGPWAFSARTSIVDIFDATRTTPTILFCAVKRNVLFRTLMCVLYVWTMYTYVHVIKISATRDEYEPSGHVRNYDDPKIRSATMKVRRSMLSWIVLR